MDSEPSENARLAAAVIGAAIRSGVAEWVICSGARNIPLLQTLLSLPEDRRGKVWNFFEERSAAFFALGRAKPGGKRIAVVTTSGTAAAELLPATIEAHYSGQELLLITGDRPPAFRGSGAPQAIEQTDLFKPYVCRSVDWQNEGDGKQVGDHGASGRPEHWNVCFDEPEATDQFSCAVDIGEAPKERRFASADSGRVVASDDTEGALTIRPSSGPFDSSVVLLGELEPGERPMVEAALAKLGAPIWAEATSGLRESASLRSLMITGGEKCVGKLNPKGVLRIGGVPSLRFWRDLETRPEIEVLSLTRTGFSGLARDSEVVGGVEILADLEAVERIAQGDANRRADLETALQKLPGSEPALFRRLSEKIDSEALVYLGNSLPIREWNLAASFEIPHPSCAANRGANGIDGQVSTFLGMCADTGGCKAGAWGIFGDLTAMYDLSAPWVLAQLNTGSKRRIVVINNGGGRIFDRLPAVREATDEQRAVIRNPHAHEFRHWAAMWGMGYARWGADDEWTEPEGDAVVIEVWPDENQTVEFWKQWDATQ